MYIGGPMAKKRDKAKKNGGGGAPSYYRPVAGSKELVTQSLSDEDIQGIEDPSFLGGREPFRIYAGEWLGRAEVDAGATVPIEIFDSLASRLTPLEQAVYYQFVRLSLGERRNFCRVGKRELTSRTGISERRLLAALDGLVRKKRIRPLHRNNFGTLYRVFLPGEGPARGADGQPLTAKTTRVSRRRMPEYNEDAYYVDPPLHGSSAGPEGRPQGNASKRTGARRPSKTPGGESRKPGASAVSRPRSRPLESPLNEERFAGVAAARGPSISVGDMVAEFFRSVKKKPSSDETDEAVSDVTSLLEDGYTREEVHRAVRWFTRRFPKENSLSRLHYYIHEALSEEEE